MFCANCISCQAVRNQIQEAQKIANGGGSEQDTAEAKIELEVGIHTNVDISKPY